MENVEKITKNKKFNYRLDYYWKSLSIYAIVLSIAIVLQESLSNVKLISAIYKPLVFLLIFIVALTSLALLYQVYKKKSLILDDSGITFSFRNGSKKFNWEKISRIVFLYDKFKQEKSVRIIKIKINNFRYIRINPSSFEHENDLINLLLEIKSKFNN